MNHQVQHVMDDRACNAQDDWNRTDKKAQRANGDTHQQGGVGLRPRRNFDLTLDSFSEANDPANRKNRKRKIERKNKKPK